MPGEGEQGPGPEHGQEHGADEEQLGPRTAADEVRQRAAEILERTARGRVVDKSHAQQEILPVVYDPHTTADIQDQNEEALRRHVAGIKAHEQAAAARARRPFQANALEADEASRDARRAKYAGFFPPKVVDENSDRVLDELIRGRLEREKSDHLDEAAGLRKRPQDGLEAVDRDEEAIRQQRRAGEESQEDEPGTNV